MNEYGLYSEYNLLIVESMGQCKLDHHCESRSTVRLFCSSMRLLKNHPDFHVTIQTIQLNPILTRESDTGQALKQQSLYIFVF